MKIAGIQKNSFVDYPGKIAAVIFTLGCNMNCYYCHNRHIIKENNQDLINPDYLISLIEKRKKFLDGIVITGGEPTLQHDLEKYIIRIKNIGYPVKLDTNGSKPEVIKKLIEKDLIDYIAMDIKAPLNRYEEICGLKNIEDSIIKSINTIINAGIEYEFRTTFVPELYKKDLYDIKDLINGAKRYVIQQYRVPDDIDYKDDRLIKKPHNKEYIQKAANEIKSNFDFLEIKGLT